MNVVLALQWLASPFEEKIQDSEFAANSIKSAMFPSFAFALCKWFVIWVEKKTSRTATNIVIIVLAKFWIVLQTAKTEKNMSSNSSIQQR